ncbi:MAG: 23S rRNA (uracil(1939)-C(5))-methyltransferase RlmD [Eubacteriales bacterium]|nr:23S rRNA (uracil(1939)-C(5))-methyltransferase RlmD [Eubacteriales bacterium]
MLAKNQLVTLTCERLGAELEGVCRYNGQTVFVPDALPGETFEAKVTKVQPTYAYARLEKFVTASPDRREPFCPVYALCGGCSGQHMAYLTTLAAKRAQVFDCLSRIGKLSITEEDVPPVLGAEEPTHCRNKTSLPVGSVNGIPTLGFYRRRSHAIVPIEDCPVAMGGVSGVVAVVKAWMADCGATPYDELTHRGLIRHVVARVSRNGDVLVLIVATEEKLPDTDGLLRALQGKVKGFCGLHISVNRMHNNVILGKTSRKLFGADFITETLLGLTFEISPLSFFQVNPAQTERLYASALAFAALSPDDTVVDAYAGAGTISLCMARRCKQVIGLEIVPQAVESARRNAERNGIGNATFHVAPVEEKLPVLVSQGLKLDVVVLDPPRKGVEPAVIDAILQAKPKRVVYVSCHVPTQARDAALLLAGGYRFTGCQPVDLFCYAGGVENVLCLERNDA